MDRFGRILGRLISIFGFLLLILCLFFVYHIFSISPCSRAHTGPEYVCEDLRPGHGVEINGINQLLDPYNDPEIVAAANDSPRNVSEVVKSMISQGKLKERIDWSTFTPALVIMAVLACITVLGGVIGRLISAAIKKLIS